MGAFINPKGEDRTLIEIIEYLIADKEKRIMLDTVPPRCAQCKILYECRDKERNYKCRNGCRIINGRIYLGDKCPDCVLLNVCRDEFNYYEFKHKKCLLRRKGFRYK